MQKSGLQEEDVGVTFVETKGGLRWGGGDLRGGRGWKRRVKLEGERKKCVVS